MEFATASQIILIGFIVLVAALTRIYIVPEYQRLVVIRLGRLVGARGPGIVFLMPLIDRAVKVDMREQMREEPRQTFITKDNTPISIDLLWNYQVLDAAQSVAQVANFEATAAGIATGVLRSVIGGIGRAEVLTQREDINTTLRTKLDEITRRSGVKVTKVEIRV